MKRFDSAVALLLFIASFALYVRTLAPSLLYGDSAEFQTIAYTLGVGHPTGYPIYVLLAKLFTFIPIGEIAYRVNLFSAFCAAVTVGLVYLIIRELGAMFIAAVYSSFTLAVTPLFWKYAAIAEIYAPSAACLAFILFAVFRWKESKNSLWLFVAGLAGGLSLGIHTTVVLSGISILIYLILSIHQPAAWFHGLRGAGIGIVIFLLSFLFLDFLNSPAGYYNAVVRPSLSVWGMTDANFDSPFERLAFLYFPPQFRGEFFSASFDQVKTRITDFIREASWSWWLVLVGFISLIVPRKASPAQWREAILIIVALITFLLFAVTYDVYDFQVFYIQVILQLVIFTGLGVNAILEIVSLISSLPRFVPTLLGLILLMIQFYLSATEIATSWKQRIPPMLEGWEGNYQFFSQHRLEAEQVLSRIEDNAIIFTGWDKLYGFYYVAHVLEGRTEMDFHETYPQEGVTKFADSAVQYIEANIDVRPIYFTKRPSQLAEYYKITRAAAGLHRVGKK